MIFVKANDFWYLSKDNAINLMNNSSLNEKTGSL